VKRGKQARVTYVKKLCQNGKAAFFGRPFFSDSETALRRNPLRWRAIPSIHDIAPLLILLYLTETPSYVVYYYKY